MNDKTFNAVITGGASGLGAATAKNITSSGGNVTILDIQEELGKETANNLGENCNFIKIDITNETLVQDCYNNISRETSPISLSVNCAGIGTPNKVLNKEGPHSLELYTKIINVNLLKIIIIILY